MKNLTSEEFNAEARLRLGTQHLQDKRAQRRKASRNGSWVK
jgi:hypothetical protein